jgi:spore coat polysaccharide biosynthesis protein SpsF (cytidylyltransferase family)
VRFAKPKVKWTVERKKDAEVQKAIQENYEERISEFTDFRIVDELVEELVALGILV